MEQLGLRGLFSSPHLGVCAQTCEVGMGFKAIGPLPECLALREDAGTPGLGKIRKQEDRAEG